MGGWSTWINHNNPSTGTGDREQLTDAEKLQLCSGGNLTRVECHVVDGDIPSYSSGEVAECSVERGFTCNNADNFPIPCSDYKARFYCECPGTKGSFFPEYIYFALTGNAHFQIYEFFFYKLRKIIYSYNSLDNICHKTKKREFFSNIYIINKFNNYF